MCYASILLIRIPPFLDNLARIRLKRKLEHCSPRLDDAIKTSVRQSLNIHGQMKQPARLQSQASTEKLSILPICVLYI